MLRIHKQADLTQGLRNARLFWWSEAPHETRVKTMEEQEQNFLEWCQTEEGQSFLKEEDQVRLKGLLEEN